MNKIQPKVHKVAKQMGYKSNEDFYNDYPTQESYEQHMAEGGKIMDDGDLSMGRDPNGNFQLGAGLTFNTAPMIAGMDMLASIPYNAKMKANEANLMRQNMQPISSANNFNGGDMPIYDRGGNVIDQYKTHPNGAKEMIEGGEYVQMPNGQGDVAQGDKHYMASGGIATDLPPESRVYSDQLKPDKDFIKAVSDGKQDRRMTYADLAAKYDSKKEDNIMNNKSSDAISKRTAGINKSFKADKLDQIFQHQEMMKNPMIAMQQESMARGGVVRYDDGAKIPYVNDFPQIPTTPFRFDQNPLPSPQTTIPYNQMMFGQPPIHDQIAPIDTYPMGNPMADAQQIQQNMQPVDVPQGPSIVKKKPFNVSVGQGTVPGWMPGATAIINAMTDSPVNSSKYQPEYLVRPEGLNIDAGLNRNLAQAKPYMSSNSGNGSVDAARALQALGSTQEANNQLYGQKFNSDSQQNYQRNAQNVQTKNQADMVNLQRMDQTYDKMNQRTANKQGAIQAVANNAYTNSRKALYDKNSQDLMSEFFSNYDWKSGKGFTFNPDGSPNIVHAPIMNNVNTQGSDVNIYEEKTNPDGSITRKKITRPKRKSEED